MLEYIIIKKPKKTWVIMPEDVLVLNEDGAVAIFPTCDDAFDFIDDNNLTAYIKELRK